MTNFDEETDMEQQPGDQFRSELQRALESTHRQHMAQQTLGIRQPYEKFTLWTNPKYQRFYCLQRLYSTYGNG